MARTAIIAALTARNSDMSLIGQGENPHWVNYISTQLKPSAVIYPNGGPQLDNPNLTEDTDKGTSSEKEYILGSSSESDSG